jgi:hypothetical protein
MNDLISVCVVESATYGAGNRMCAIDWNPTFTIQEVA